MASRAVSEYSKSHCNEQKIQSKEAHLEERLRTAEHALQNVRKVKTVRILRTEYCFDPPFCQR
jgi:hypothetical protein